MGSGKDLSTHWKAVTVSEYGFDSIPVNPYKHPKVKAFALQKTDLRTIDLCMGATQGWGRNQNMLYLKLFLQRLSTN